MISELRAINCVCWGDTMRRGEARRHDLIESGAVSGMGRTRTLFTDYKSNLNYFTLTST